MRERKRRDMVYPLLLFVYLVIEQYTTLFTRYPLLKVVGAIGLVISLIGLVWMLWLRDHWGNEISA
ncbi:hypothetical protein C447_06541 [Halococcus hamelinensis 100A6]|uniref:Uncharacterized protein n=1 Tax=Halococcus hamelinensis 100A6 TaxID=1132509 RepID=M0M4S3_9EURY|nr:hypothetical protein C447_06541 [Halococcus hamelinensis 100A6]